MYPRECGCKLHIAAGKAEVEWPERILAAPVDQVIELGQQNVLACGLFDDVVLVLVDAGRLRRAAPRGIDSCERVVHSRYLDSAHFRSRPDRAGAQSRPPTRHR